jgi:hypothetical protein
MKVASALVASLCAVGALGHTQDEIDKKGEEVMEEYRKDGGHWQHISEARTVDHMVDMVGVSTRSAAPKLLLYVRALTIIHS